MQKFVSLSICSQYKLFEVFFMMGKEVLVCTATHRSLIRLNKRGVHSTLQVARTCLREMNLIIGNDMLAIFVQY